MTLNPTAGDLHIIARIAVFRGLKPETVQHIIAPATAVTLKAHSVRPGDPATAFFIVIDGWINLYWINVSGEETVIHILNQRRQLCRGNRLYRRAFPGDREGGHQRQGRTDTGGSCRQVHSRKSGYCTCDDRVNIAAFASSSAASRAAQSTARRAARCRISGIVGAGRTWFLRHRIALRQGPDRSAARPQARIAVSCLRQIKICRSCRARRARGGKRYREASSAGYGRKIDDPGNVS